MAGPRSRVGKAALAHISVLGHRAEALVFPAPVSVGSVAEGAAAADAARSAGTRSAARELLLQLTEGVRIKQDVVGSNNRRMAITMLKLKANTGPLEFLARPCC